MSIDWTHFTPWSALAGGVLIGLAAAVLVLGHGRIAGVSGILGGLLRSSARDRAWRVAFLVGVIGAPLLWQGAHELPVSYTDANWAAIVLAGLAVGIGTRYGAGCTSGHGVCGLARLSPRSMVATIAFMLAGGATVFALRHLFV